MPYSITDVAKRAGISKSTVSRVLNGGSVSDKAKRATLAAIEEMDYHPSGLARGLRGIKGKVVGVFTLGSNVFNSKPTVHRLAAMNEVLINNGYSILLINPAAGANPSALDNAFRFLQENRVDGVILLGAIESESDKASLSKYRELVYTGERLDPKKGFRAYMGNYNYSRDVYTYLATNGHARVLTISSRSPINTSIIKRRMQAYSDVCQMFNQPFDSKLTLSLALGNAPDDEWLAESLKSLRRSNCTAIFSDDMAIAHQIQEYFALHALECPRDYSLVSIERKGEAVENSITSVCLSDHEYGEKVAELMLEVIANPEMTIKDVNIPYFFKMRDSVRKI